jgi:hypothetical protein
MIDTTALRPVLPVKSMLRALAIDMAAILAGMRHFLTRLPGLFIRHTFFGHAQRPTAGALRLADGPATSAGDVRNTPFFDLVAAVFSVWVHSYSPSGWTAAVCAACTSIAASCAVFSASSACCETASPCCFCAKS